MMRLIRMIVAGMLTAILAALPAKAETSPYAGMQGREIKALSGQQIEDLQAGRGMGMALAAELNGYPGPVHVIELARQLELSDVQLSRTRALFDEMRHAAVPLGEALLAKEAALDRSFAAAHVEVDDLHRLLAEIAGLQG